MFHRSGPYAPLSCFAALECPFERRQRRAAARWVCLYPQEKRGIPPCLHDLRCRDLAHFPRFVRYLPLTSRIGPVQALWVGASSLLHNPCFPHLSRHQSCTVSNHYLATGSEEQFRSS